MSSWEQQIQLLLDAAIDPVTGALRVSDAASAAALAALNGVYDSSSVGSNRDGNVLEKTEYIIGQLAGAQPIRVVQGESLPATIDLYSSFDVYLYDVNSTPFSVADIDISTATFVLEQSRSGGAFTAVAIPQPTLQKSEGSMYARHLFAGANWDVDDTYRLTLVGAKITSLAITLQTFIWQGNVDIITLLAEDVTYIKDAITAPENNSTEVDTIAQTVGRKGDLSNTSSTASSMGLLRNLLSSVNCRRVLISEVVNNTSFKTDQCAPVITGSFDDWYISVLRSTSTTMGEFQQVTSWTNNGATGTFVHPAFVGLLTAGDSVLLVHPMIYNSYLIKAETDKITAEVIKTAAIKAKTDNLPADTNALLNAIAGYIDTEVAAILLETNKIPATITKIDNITSSMFPIPKVYPTLADGVSINGGASWVLGAFTQIVPINTIASRFQINSVLVSSQSANDTYELVLYSGTLGNEVEIWRARVARAATGYYAPIVLNSALVAANSRISAKLASGSGNDNVTISIGYSFV